MARSWLLGWWPLPPSAGGITRQLIHVATAERLPVGRDRSLAPTSLRIAVSPVEFTELEGRHLALELSLSDLMREAAEDNEWRCAVATPRVELVSDPDARIGWPIVVARYDSPAAEEPRAGRRAPETHGSPEGPTLSLPADESPRARWASHDVEGPTRRLHQSVELPDGRLFDLLLPATRVGRGRISDLSILAAEVSREHALLKRVGTAVWLEDLGSANGTFADGRRLSEPVRLVDGTNISLGQHGPTLIYREVVTS
jgi:hypothetical protein